MSVNVGLKSLVVLGLCLLSGCSLFQSQSSVPAVQVCPLPPACPVCKPTMLCPAPKVIEKVPAPKVMDKVVVSPIQNQPSENQLKPELKTAGKLNLPIVGGVELVLVEPSGIKYEARIDTGAESSSVHAESIQLIERDGRRYVRFSLINPETRELVEMERRLRRKVLIKQQLGESERRYVVKLWMTLGKIRELVDVTLSDRTDFEYPVLVGRNLLTDTAIVDVSLQHTLK